ncbi:hypothetical protein SAMN04488503_2297 [Humidesulfovibrio mexicanus]|uniref:Uncharacterized protein n=1 Tax=Humidesulfovibrio mexicanus TaxID=147047 RepID=A0A239AYQ1_9BACT|nr:hypothetical protein [Humidesulfovibrio mexicanus]SNS00491.1 hypothetical protein SAMN04488503_2297 [Humidesulfovibrio mexicanus]
MGTPDFNVPLLTATEAGYAAALLDLFRGLALGLDTSANNPPTGAIRWNSANGRWEKFDGTSWGALASRYFIDVDTLDGLHANDLALAGHNHSGTYQPLASVLTLLGGLTPAADTIGYFAGPSAAARTAFTALARTLLGCTDTANMRATLGLVIGTNVQAQDATLAALAALTTAADKLIYATGSDAFATCDFPAAARTLLAATTVALQRSALGLGGAALLTAGAAAGNVPVLDASGKLSSALIPGGVGGVDTLARDTAIRNAIRLGVQIADASSSIPWGYLFLFATDELATKTGATYQGTNKLYDYQTTANVDNPTTPTTGTPSLNGYTFADRQVAVENGAYITHIRIRSSSSFSGTAYIFSRSGTTYTVVASVAVSHTGGGWQSFALASAYTVPTTGTYFLGAYSANFGSAPGYTGGYRSYVGGQISGSATMTEDSNNVIPMGYTKGAATAGMTLISAAISVGSAPSSVDAYFLHRAIDSVTLNTDIKARVSRDGGSTWSGYVTLAEVCAVGDYKLLKGTADLSPTNSGASLTWEATTHNFKSQQLRAAALQIAA